MDLEVVIGTYDCTIKGFTIDVLEAEENGLQKKYQEKEHTGCVRAIACGGRYLATGGTDEVIKLYNIRKHTEIGTLLQHEGSITCLAFRGEKLLLSASEDGTICVWRCGGEWDLVHTLKGHKYAVTSLAVHPSGKLALSVGKDRTLRTWDLHGGRGVFTQRLKKAADLVLWSTIADQYVLTFDSLVVVHEVETGNPVTTIDIGKHVNSIAYVQDTILAVGSEHPYIQLFCIASGECVAKLDGHTSRVKALSLSPGGELLFSASSDGAIKVWRIAEPLSTTRCISSIDSGSRVTSMALVSPESLLRDLKDTPQPTKSNEPTAMNDQIKTQESLCTSEKLLVDNPTTLDNKVVEPRTIKKRDKNASARLSDAKKIELKTRLSKKQLSKTKRLAKS